ncbi:hypothetical protein Bca4012_022622 [Brassica carinata]
MAVSINSTRELIKRSSCSAHDELTPREQDTLVRLNKGMLLSYCRSVTLETSLQKTKNFVFFFTEFKKEETGIIERKVKPGAGGICSGYFSKAVIW